MFGELSRYGMKLNISDLDNNEKRLIERELIVSPVMLEQLFPKKFKVYKKTDEHVYLPRFWAKDNLERLNIKENFNNPHKMDDTVHFVGKLRKELQQDKAAEAVIDSLTTYGGGILSLDVGYGKTFVSLYVATKLRLKTMILVHKTFLADQFEESIRKFIPNAKVSKIRGDVCDTSGDFVICMIQTLLARKYDSFEDIGMLITDESHHTPAESFSQAMFGISFKYVLGLTATPYRKDGLTRVLHWFFGPTAYEARRKGQDNVMVKIVPFTHEEYHKPPPINKRGDLCYTSLITKICDIPDRTHFIANQAKILAETGRYVLVLSHRRGHATMISEELKKMGIDAGTYLGGDKVAPNVQVVCATYSLASEGYDNPKLNGLVLATPSSDVVQACGRILRGGSGNDPIIVDIIDQYSLFFSQLAKRKTYYKKIGFTIFGDTTGTKKETPPKEESLFVEDD